MHANLELRDEYWRTMKAITPVLKSLEVAVSLSVVYPVVCGLMNERLLPSEENSILFNTFMNAVRKSLKDRFKPSDRDWSTTRSCDLSATPYAQEAEIPCK
ncbi:hypothetical protein AAFF_G00115510 [Aldrovandia affinis]|uniref:Uncharacterized protein n=1 Tax=Aldrovandia affinis TaxID=143900 RepID=A0AAD7RT14_9TELE|nr:hypothetical protein AAFF_G00115510 [Aldrovandia affinis]